MVRKTFGSRVRKDASGCWLWTGSKWSTGYGEFEEPGKRHLAHRYAYELAKGPIPTGWHVHHRCETPACVNPDHLEAMWSGDHMALHDGVAARNARKTHCQNGHPLSGKNLYTNPKTGHRMCWTCQRAWKKLHPWKKRRPK